MKRHIDRITGLGIKPENSSFTITSRELLQAVSEEIDMETITDHELREIIFYACKALNRMDWKSTVTHALNHLPTGLNQTGIAFEGMNPCSSECPDALIEDQYCFHKHACKAWEIYEAQLQGGLL